MFQIRLHWSGSGPRHFAEVGLGSGWSIQVLAISGFRTRPRFFMIKNFFWSKTYVYVFLNASKGHIMLWKASRLQPNRELFKDEIFIFPCYWDNFGLPGSGFPIWIRIRSTVFNTLLFFSPFPKLQFWSEQYSTMKCWWHTHLLSRCLASSWRPPARIGIGGGSWMEMVFALFVFAVIYKQSSVVL